MPKILFPGKFWERQITIPGLIFAIFRDPGIPGLQTLVIALPRWPILLKHNFRNCSETADDKILWVCYCPILTDNMILLTQRAKILLCYIRHINLLIDFPEKNV